MMWLTPVERDKLEKSIQSYLHAPTAEVTYTKPTAPLVPPRTLTVASPKSSLKVLEQLVGGTVLRLDNGDVIELRIFVDEMVFDPEHGSFKPVYRLVPEVVLAGLPGGMQCDTDGETAN